MRGVVQAGLLVIFGLGMPRAGGAIGPHEVLLLVNGQSPDSAAVADAFARLRAIPTSNVVRLSLPLPEVGQPFHITPQDFTRHIWDPACRAVRERGLDEQILAWVYSTDFPVAVQTTPPMSLQGITFVRNRIPTSDVIEKARMISPLFAGPSQPSGNALSSQSFDVARESLASDYPLPSMMLGYTGVRGVCRDVVLRCLQRGRASDGTRPGGTVYFVTSADIRSRCRAWQFASAALELQALGVRSVITNAYPAGGTDILGVMMGTATLPFPLGQGFLPGAMAEHLTSSAAVFHEPSQSKLSAWIEAGVTASAGAVTEPYSAWEKFPAARFYAHYASGCTMIESFFQAIRCPLQILLVGDPLACPWAPPLEVTLLGLDRSGPSSPVRVTARIASGPASVLSRIVVLWNGRRVLDRRGVVSGRGHAPFTLEVFRPDLRPGPHTIRLVAYRSGMVRSQGFTERELCVESDGRVRWRHP